MRVLRLALLLLLPALPAAADPALAVQAFAPASIATILGHAVLDPSGDEIGRLVDVLVDPDGRPRAAVLDVGGFLGIGMRRVAVAWEAFRFAPGTGEIRLTQDLSTDQVSAAPEFRGADQPMQILQPRRPAIQP